MFEDEGLSCLVMSIDDFYLTGAEQDHIAKENGSNRLLQSRGNAGTHDIPLMMSTLQDLQSMESGQQSVNVPLYDKSLRGGRGDRAPADRWLRVEHAPDVILLEGWMLGFKALSGEEELYETLPAAMKQINTLMRGYEQFHRMFDNWVVLAVEDPMMIEDSVQEWRLQAEREMKSKGKPGMSDDAVGHEVLKRDCVICVLFVILTVNIIVCNNWRYSIYWQLFLHLIGSSVCIPIRPRVPYVPPSSVQRGSGEKNG
jgi:D-glycerate 3-kinase